jgi:putative flippase GtrA
VRGSSLSPEPEVPEKLPSRATVERPAAPLQPTRRRAAAALRSVRNWQQLGKFCVVGAIGYVINLAVYDTLLHEGLHYLAAATCSFLVAVTSNYTWNRHWTFRDERGHLGIQGMRFLLVSLAALGANLVVLHVLVSPGGIGKLPAQAAAIVLVTPLNFVGNKLWSFSRRRT